MFQIQHDLGESLNFGALRFRVALCRAAAFAFV